MPQFTFFRRPWLLFLSCMCVCACVFFLKKAGFWNHLLKKPNFLINGDQKWQLSLRPSYFRVACLRPWAKQVIIYQLHTILSAPSNWAPFPFPHRPPFFLISITEGSFLSRPPPRKKTTTLFRKVAKRNSGTKEREASTLTSRILCWALVTEPVPPRPGLAISPP